MISVDDILKLINAGFSKAEIMQLSAAPAGDPAQANDPAPAPAGDPAPAGEPAGDPAPAPSPATEDLTQKLLSGITGQLQALTSAVQANNIRGASSPANGPETTEDIIKSMFESK